MAFHAPSYEYRTKNLWEKIKIFVISPEQKYHSGAMPNKNTIREQCRTKIPFGNNAEQKYHSGTMPNKSTIREQCRTKLTYFLVQVSQPIGCYKQINFNSYLILTSKFILIFIFKLGFVKFTFQ